MRDKNWVWDILFFVLGWALPIFFRQGLFWLDMLLGAMAFSILFFVKWFTSKEEEAV